MTIFLSISSYKDPLLINTLQSAYKNAKNKDSIIFAVVDQNDQKLERNEKIRKNISTMGNIFPIPHYGEYFSNSPLWGIFF